jgi:acyl-CoA thioester hydrolase
MTPEDFRHSGVIDGGVHRMPIRVYYAETDAGGVVYHANYLVFAERARTEWLRLLGRGEVPLGQEGGFAFVVRHCTLDYQAPARLGDLLEVVTEVKAIGGASLTVEHRVERDRHTLVTIVLRLVCIDGEFRPIRVPDRLRAELGAYLPIETP